MQVHLVPVQSEADGPEGKKLKIQKPQLEINKPWMHLEDTKSANLTPDAICMPMGFFRKVGRDKKLLLRAINNNVTSGICLKGFRISIGTGHNGHLRPKLSSVLKNIYIFMVTCCMLVNVLELFCIY